MAITTIQNRVLMPEGFDYRNQSRVDELPYPLTKIELAQIANGKSLSTYEPYLAMPLIKNDKPERLLFVPYTANLEKDLLSSDEPLNTFLERVRDDNKAVIIVEWWKAGDTTTPHFFKVEAKDLLAAYPVSK